eukprot:TRINITY_DN8864_c0_g1_i3.p1 TRINITY_DN8864_c0_g1~~TRINITY_DN8864_c0_g1_i3.p1  ORF type:complete len:571 (-),score=131.63 TRINITY_DN8864_c0_g1_i3:80-1792(-)
MDDSIWSQDPTHLNQHDSEYVYSRYVDVLRRAFGGIRRVRTVQPKVESAEFSNSIGPAGAGPLIQALAENQTLTALDLLGNPIGSDAVQHMFEMLLGNPRLRELGFSCWLDQAPCLSAEAIAAMMKTLECPDSRLALVDMGSVVLMPDDQESGGSWSQSTVPKASPPKSHPKSPQKSTKRTDMASKAGVTETEFGEVVGAKFFFRSPDLAKAVLTERSQAKMVKVLAQGMKQELAGVLQGERVIPQSNPAMEELHGTVSRIDAQIREKKTALAAAHQQELAVGSVATKRRVVQLTAELAALDNSLQSLVDAHEWRGRCLENARQERQDSGWGPPRGRTHPDQQERVVAFGSTTKVGMEDRLPFGDRVFLEGSQTVGRELSFPHVEWRTLDGFRCQGTLQHGSFERLSFPCDFYLKHSPDLEASLLSICIQGQPRMVQVTSDGRVDCNGSLGIGAQFIIIPVLPTDQRTKFQLKSRASEAQHWFLGACEYNQRLKCGKLGEICFDPPSLVLLDSLAVPMRLSADGKRLIPVKPSALDAEGSPQCEEVEVEEEEEMDQLLVTALEMSGRSAP